MKYRPHKIYEVKCSRKLSLCLAVELQFLWLYSKVTVMFNITENIITTKIKYLNF